MKINKEYTEDHQVKLIVELDPEPLNRAKNQAAKSLSRKTKIPGFRPGKAPYSVIERTLGEGTILENAIDILIEEIYPEVIKESGISPYGPGTLENMPTLDPPTFEFLVPLDAEVKLGDYASIRIPYELKEITEEDVNNVLNDLRSRQAVLEPVDRPVKEGDQVFIRLEGKKLGIQEGLDDELVKDRPMPVIIESEDEDAKTEWPFPGFSRELIGHSSGDNLVLSHKFADDSEFESLRGIDAEFKIKVEDIKSRIIPDLDDEFAKSVGDYEGLEELIKAIRENLEEQSLLEYNSEYHQQIIEKIIEEADIKFPPQMLKNEINVYIEQLENRLKQQGLDLEIYLKSRKITLDTLEDEIHPQAEERLKRSLILFEVSKSEDIQVDEVDVENQTQASLEELSRSMTPEQVKKTFTQDFMRGWVGNITADLIVQKTLERLRDIAQGNDVGTEEAIEEHSQDQETELTSDESKADPIQPDENEKNNPDENSLNE